jgi:hypothetical protein
MEFKKVYLCKFLLIEVGFFDDDFVDVFQEIAASVADDKS